MSDIVKSALIILVGLIIASFLSGGVYQIVIASAGSGGSRDTTGDVTFAAFRLNRFTGQVMFMGSGLPYMVEIRKPPSKTSN